MKTHKTPFYANRFFLTIAIFALAVSLAAVALGGTDAAESGGQATPAPQSIEKKAQTYAVVDLEGIRKNYDKFKDRTGEISAHEDKLVGELDAMKKKIRQLTSKRDQCREKGPEWWKYDNEMRRLEADYNSAFKKARSEIDAMDLKLMETLIGDITTAIGDYAKQNGIKLVFWKKQILLNQPTIAERARSIEMASILYADKSIDISAPIIKMLNEKYAAQKSGPKKPTEEK